METIPVRQIKANQKDLDFAEAFSIRTIQELLNGKNMSQDLHRHDFFFIMILQKGVGIHEIDFTPYQVCNRCVFFMRPGQVHQLDLKVGCKGFLMQFKPDFYYPSDKLSIELLRMVSLKTFCQLNPDSFKKLISILNTIHMEFIHKQEKYQEIIKASLGIFFIELVRNRQLGKNNLLRPANSYQQERLDEFISLLEAYVATHKDVPFYTDKLNLSTFQLNAITKKMLGKTCSELINEHIILEGKRHLLATSNQVNQIAHLLGYDDPSYFIRFFKKNTGYSPEAFRKKFK